MAHLLELQTLFSLEISKKRMLTKKNNQKSPLSEGFFVEYLQFLSQIPACFA